MSDIVIISVTSTCVHLYVNNNLSFERRRESRKGLMTFNHCLNYSKLVYIKLFLKSNNIFFYSFFLICFSALPCRRTYQSMLYFKEKMWCAHIYLMILIDVAPFGLINFVQFYKSKSLLQPPPLLRIQRVCVHLIHHWCAVPTIFIVCRCS